MDYKRVYFLGIGGIGMSAIARYFLHEGMDVAGYDRTPTPLTRELEGEGAEIHYQDDVAQIESAYTDPTTTLIVYTPAIPADHKEYNYFKNNGFEIVKRSKMLGHISQGKYVMAVAGTHGKTSTTTLTSWLNHTAGGGGSAFLGGISVNFGTNLVLDNGDRLAVEADEFDRSFLQLHPNVAVITSADADHLDIYGTHEKVKEAFSQFVDQIVDGGTLIVKLEVDIELNNNNINIYRYSYDTPCDFYARNVRLLDGGYYSYDIVCPDRVIEGCQLGVPGWVNIENSVAAVALLWVAGFDEQKLKEGLKTFSGVKRRFEFYVNTPNAVYMDDYAHHPKELQATITSLKGMFPGRSITAIFQPHLYTRTRDLYTEFAQALSLADRVVLLPIYPAREEPIEGVDSELIAKHITTENCIVEKDNIAQWVEEHPNDIIVSFGAGNIDNCCDDIAKAVKKSHNL